MSSEIQRDIGKWSEQRLRQWFVDSVHRYEMIDIDQNTAIAHTATTLMLQLVILLSNMGVSADEASKRLHDTIIWMREGKAPHDYDHR